MLISKVPLRLSLIGGGSDLPEFYDRGNDGQVVGFAINRHICIYANRPLVIDKSLIKYSHTETFTDPDTINHPLYREIIKRYLTDKSNIELASFADIKSGTGLGSSSAFAVALIAVIKSLQGERFTPYSLTREGFDIERGVLGEPVGLQDGAFAAYGGCCHFVFSHGNKVLHSSINLDTEVLEKLESSVFLVFTEESRDASKSLGIHARSLNNDDRKYEMQMKIMGMVPEGIEALVGGDIRRLGEIVRETYELKKQLNGDVDIKIGKVFDFERVLQHDSVYGYKILGAGGGGFYAVIGDGKRCEQYLVDSGLRPVAIKIDFRGCRVLEYDKQI